MPYDLTSHTDEAIEYVVDIGDNLELAEAWLEADLQGKPAEQDFFWVKLMPMPSRDLDKINTQKFAGFHTDGGKAKATREARKRAEAVYRRVFDLYVPEVHNLELRNTDGTVRSHPKTGVELYEESLTGSRELRVEVIEDIIEALKRLSKAEKGDLKKLRQQCAGRLHETTAINLLPGTGVAPNATLTISTTNAVPPRRETD